MVCLETGPRLRNIGKVAVSGLVIFGFVAAMTTSAVAEQFMTTFKATGTCECPAEKVEGTFDECPLEAEGGPACGDRRCFKADTTDAGCAENYTGEYCGCLKDCTYTPDPGQASIPPSTGMASPGNTPEGACVNNTWHDGDGTWSCTATKYKKKKKGDTASGGYNDFACYYTPGVARVLGLASTVDLSFGN